MKSKTSKEIKEVNITGCEECLFRYSHYDDYSMGDSFLEICILKNKNDYDYNAKNRKETPKFESTIIGHDGFKTLKKIKTPEWCPLKENSVLVKFKK